MIKWISHISGKDELILKWGLLNNIIILIILLSKYWLKKNIYNNGIQYENYTMDNQHLEENDYNFLNPEVLLVKNTINFLKDVIGKKSPITIRSNVYAKYFLNSEEGELDENGKLVWKKNVMPFVIIPSNDIHKIDTSNTDPITFDKISTIMDKILKQIIIVDKSGSVSAGYYMDTKYDNVANEYVMLWNGME